MVKKGEDKTRDEDQTEDEDEMEDKNQIEDIVNRVVCDFDSDNPTMVIAEAIHDDTLDTKLDVNTKFTFDKRKVGLEKIPCKCDSHVRNAPPR